MILWDLWHLFIMSFINDILYWLSAVYRRLTLWLAIVINVVICWRITIEYCCCLLFQSLLIIAWFVICYSQCANSPLQFLFGQWISVHYDLRVNNNDFITEWILSSVLFLSFFWHWFRFSKNIFFELIDKVNKLHDFFV